MYESTEAFAEETDESLLMLSRSGNITAQFALTKRYFDRKFILAKQASLPLASMFGNWDLNHIFFSTFVRAVDRYELGQAAKFSTYFLTCFRHDLIAEAKNTHLFERGATLSLDEDKASPSSEDGFTLLDVLEAPNEDPMKYIDYFDECLANGRYGNKINGAAVDVARLKIYGYSFRYISKLMNQSIRQCKNLFDEFAALVKQFFPE